MKKTYFFFVICMVIPEKKMYLCVILNLKPNFNNDFKIKNIVNLNHILSLKSVIKDETLNIKNISFRFWWEKIALFLILKAVHFRFKERKKGPQEFKFGEICCLYIVTH